MNLPAPLPPRKRSPRTVFGNVFAVFGLPGQLLGQRGRCPSTDKRPSCSFGSPPAYFSPIRWLKVQVSTALWIGS